MDLTNHSGKLVVPSGLCQPGHHCQWVNSKSTKEKGEGDAQEAPPMTTTLCPPLTQILNDVDTCRQRLWKKVFIGVVVSTLPMNGNTRPPGPPPPSLASLPHPSPCPDPGNGRQCGMGPTPPSEVQSLPLAPPCPCSALVPQALGGVVRGGCLSRVPWSWSWRLGILVWAGDVCDASLPRFV